MSGLWYYQQGENDDIILASRIRLLRNIEGYTFPCKMTEKERISLNMRVRKELPDITPLLNSGISYTDLPELSNEEREAFRERVLINEKALSGEAGTGVFVSEDEAFSMTLNSSDHLRLLLSCHGQGLPALYKTIGGIEDIIGERLPFSYSEKYGFKTSSVSNVGTGMRAYIVMHIPLLSERKDFGALSAEMSKYGVVMKAAENVKGKPGCGLYVLYNQRTLGLSETGIMELLQSVSDKLLHEERKARTEISSMNLSDRAFRSYGVLKYAVKMDLWEGLWHLSNLMLGASEGYIKEGGKSNTYELMIGIHPGNLQMNYGAFLDEEELKEKRAEYIREAIRDFSIIR